MFRRKQAKTPDDVAREAIIALYQRFWHEEGQQEYLTAVIVKDSEGFKVIAVDGEFRGAYSITGHETLEEAREAVIAWVGEPREVGVRSGLVPQTIWLKLRTIILTGDAESDPPFM